MTQNEIIENNRLIAEFMGELILLPIEYATEVLILDKKHPFYNTTGRITYVDNESVSVFCNDKSNRWVDIDKVQSIEYKNIDAKFHSSWDWLMPVVEKIEETHHTNMMAKPNGFIFLITSGNIDNPMSIKYFKGSPGNPDTAKTKIEATYNAVTDFIKWYNLNK